jgi:hypothetical protein
MCIGGGFWAQKFSKAGWGGVTTFLLKIFYYHSSFFFLFFFFLPFSFLFGAVSKGLVSTTKTSSMTVAELWLY